MRLTLVLLALALPASASGQGRLAFGCATGLCTSAPDGQSEEVAGPGAAPSWSPDGMRLAFVNGSALTLSDPNGGSRAVVETDVPVAAVAPAWSPDGRQLAYVDATSATIHVVDLNAANDHVVATAAPGSSAVTDPAWSPDGTRLAFTRTSATQDSTVVVAPIAGGAEQTLVDDASSPAWKPDGSLLAVAHSGKLYTVAPDGSGLADTGLTGSDPAWSPDGTTLAYATTDGLVAPAGCKGTAVSWGAAPDIAAATAQRCFKDLGPSTYGNQEAAGPWTATAQRVTRNTRRLAIQVEESSCGSVVRVEVRRTRHKLVITPIFSYIVQTGGPPAAPPCTAMTPRAIKVPLQGQKGTRRIIHGS